VIYSNTVSVVVIFQAARHEMDQDLNEIFEGTKNVELLPSPASLEGTCKATATCKCNALHARPFLIDGSAFKVCHDIMLDH